MENEKPLSFENLVTIRQQIQQFCSSHYRTLMQFQSEAAFKFNAEDPPLQKDEARHLSSSATCIESLLECLDSGEIDLGAVKTLGANFSRLALIREEWESDGSAHVYCRCRTLPVVVACIPTYDPEIEKHLEYILTQLNGQDARHAIGEASGGKEEDWYPPNAFHTYWTLHIIQLLRERFPNDFQQLTEKLKKKGFDFDPIQDEMLLWAKQVAGYQMALHAAQSSTLDSDQLAWALAILMSFDKSYRADLGNQDFLRQGLHSLFSEQTKTGIWRTGRPLFHYKNSGNAYCYVFETFSVVLKTR